MSCKRERKIFSFKITRAHELNKIVMCTDESFIIINAILYSELINVMFRPIIGHLFNIKIGRSKFTKLELLVCHK